MRHRATGIDYKRQRIPKTKRENTLSWHSSRTELFLGRLLPSRACLRLTLTG